MLHIPETTKIRIVILGAGFGGMRLAQKLDQRKFQIVLIDRNNYHQFQPLFYQVAMAGLEPSSISFPLRKAFQNRSDTFIRVAEVLRIDTDENEVITSEGSCRYDKLIIGLGAKTNFYGNQKMEDHTYGLKSLSQSLLLRNDLLSDLEAAILEKNYDKRQGYIDVTIVGGGATGVEVAGALAELKKFVFPKDYKELDTKEVDIYLIQSGGALLPGMSKKSSEAAEKFLISMGVTVIKNTKVTDVEGDQVFLSNGEVLLSRKVIWAAGITCHKLQGLSESSFGRSNRLLVNNELQLIDYKNIYAVGDQALLSDDLPQVAQVAIQMGDYLARTFNGKKTAGFKYKDKGSMATIGRNKAVVDLPGIHFHGFFAWLIWLVVHLFALIGVKNKVFVLFNWIWNYMTYDQSLRLILKADARSKS